MNRFRAVSLAAVALVALLATPALADPKAWVEPPTGSPAKPLEKSQDIEFLFGALKAAPDEESAKAVEQRIWAKWIVSESDTTNLLMTRVKTAIDAKDLDLAIKLLDAIVQIRPDYVEGWNRRATLHYMKKEYGESLADIRRVLALEPRHFGALTGFGLIMQEFDEDKLALEAFRKALAVHPHLQRIPDLVEKLTEKVEGRGI
jgi:tetratricopeptide (TPR) repeat protein